MDTDGRGRQPFELGGDSHPRLPVVARARERGLTGLSIAEMFRPPDGRRGLSSRVFFFSLIFSPADGETAVRAAALPGVRRGPRGRLQAGPFKDALSAVASCRTGFVFPRGAWRRRLRGLPERCELPRPGAPGTTCCTKGRALERIGDGASPMLRSAFDVLLAPRATASSCARTARRPPLRGWFRAGGIIATEKEQQASAARGPGSKSRAPVSGIHLARATAHPASASTDTHRNDDSSITLSEPFLDGSAWPPASRQEEAAAASTVSWRVAE